MSDRSHDSSQALDAMPIGFAHLDGELRHLRINDQAERFAARPRSEILGRTLLEAFPSMKDSPVERALQRARETREPQRATTLFLDTGLWYEARVVPQADGTLFVFIVEGQDGDRMARELDSLREALGRERRLYETLLGGTPDFAYVWSLDYKFLYANPSLLKLYGVPAEKCIGHGFRDVGYPDWHASMHEREIDEVVRTGCPLRGKIPFYASGGGGIYDYIFVPVLGPGGRVEAVGGITRDVTDLDRTTQALQEADRRKDEFLATLAHELRNPLAPILTGLQLMDAAPNSEAAVAARATMHRQLTHIVHLVDDLLDLSRVSRGAIELRKRRLDLRVVIEGAVVASSSSTQQHRHTLNVTLPSRDLPVEGDDTRLSQVVSNLVSNAIKYTPDGGTITIVADVHGAQARIRVRDTGIGIAEADLDRVFEMFTQVKNDADAMKSGLGIGLHVVQRLVAMHGGTVHARSEGSGRGSEFSVLLPLTDAAAPSSSQPMPVVGPRPRRILIVDDNVDAAFLLSMLLKSQGHDVHATNGALEALDLARTFRPEVILMDIGMPQLNGYEACKLLRQMDVVKHAYIVAITGWGQDEDRRLAREAGFDAHLVKPATLERIDQLLAQVPERFGAPVAHPVHR